MVFLVLIFDNLTIFFESMFIGAISIPRFDFPVGPRSLKTLFILARAYKRQDIIRAVFTNVINTTLMKIYKANMLYLNLFLLYVTFVFEGIFRHFCIKAYIGIGEHQIIELLTLPNI